MMTKTAVKLVVAGAIAAGLLIAQGPRFGRPGMGNAANASEWRLDRMSALLNLTDSQKQQAKVIFDAADAAAQALEPALTQAQTALHDAARANKPAVEIDKLAAALGSVLGQMRAIHAKAFAQFYGLLTTAQREQVDKGVCPCMGLANCPRGYGMGMMGGGFGRGPRW